MRRINSFATSSEMITGLLKVSAVQLERCCEGRKLLVANRQRNRMCIDIMRVGSFLLDRAIECAKALRSRNLLLDRAIECAKLS